MSTRECRHNEITVQKYLLFCHGYTERVAIKVVGGIEMTKDKVHEFYLSESATTDSEQARLLEYYADVPIWNLHIEYAYLPSFGVKGRYLTGVLTANCHYGDVREGYLREKRDIRNEKQRMYRHKRKEAIHDAVQG